MGTQTTVTGGDFGARAAFEANRGNTDTSGEIAAMEYLRNWHDEVHPGDVRHCLREPCYGLSEILRG